MQATDRVFKKADITFNKARLGLFAALLVVLAAGFMSYGTGTWSPLALQAVVGLIMVLVMEPLAEWVYGAASPAKWALFAVMWLSYMAMTANVLQSSPASSRCCANTPTCATDLPAR